MEPSLDISQVVSVVAKYMANPSKEHWNAIKWILRYLKGTKELGIMFERQHGETNIVGFVDSDYASDLDKRRSITGYVFTCVDGPMSWRSNYYRSGIHVNIKGSNMVEGFGE